MFPLYYLELIMISSLETDTPTNRDLIISIPINPELIIISRLETEIPANPDLILSISPLCHPELIIISSIETDTPTNPDLIISIRVNTELVMVSILRVIHLLTLT